jgi:RNA polymerase-interacting CarD/CdnL/TRCF family regulator
MHGDYSEEKWISLYQSAMLELSHALMAGRIMDARSEILRRLEKLRDMPGLHEVERQAIQDALSGLRTLERVEAGYASKSHQEAAKSALEKLRSIEPAITLHGSDSPEQE